MLFLKKNVTNKVNFISADRPRKKPSETEQEEYARKHQAFCYFAQMFEHNDSANVTDVREYKYVHGATRYEADVDYIDPKTGKRMAYTLNVAVIPSDLARVEIATGGKQ